jgi:hypothetical protein
MVSRENLLYYENNRKQNVNMLCDETQLFVVTAAYAVHQRINSQAENFT